MNPDASGGRTRFRSYRQKRPRRTGDASEREEVSALPPVLPLAFDGRGLYPKLSHRALLPRWYHVQPVLPGTEADAVGLRRDHGYVAHPPRGRFRPGDFGVLGNRGVTPPGSLAPVYRPRRIGVGAYPPRRTTALDLTVVPGGASPPGAPCGGGPRSFGPCIWGRFTFVIQVTYTVYYRGGRAGMV